MDGEPVSFPVFNLLGYTGRPDLPWMHPIHYSDRAFFKQVGVNQWDKSRGDEACTREFARKASGRLTCIKIEHWPIDNRSTSDAEVEAYIGKFAAIIDWIRDENPGIRLGIYSMLPIRDYWAPVHWASRDMSRVHDWTAANARLRKSRDERGRYIAEGLADKVDCIMPSLYTFYEDQDGWETYARANIAEARRYGKQVYPFLWAHYHNSNATLGGQLIGLDYWRRQVALCRELADGIIAWGGWQVPWTDEVAAYVEALK